MRHAHLFIFLIGCAAPSAAPGPGEPTTTRGGIGAACRHDLDCIHGAACLTYTCDFVGPCSDTTTFSGASNPRVYTYDSAGRPLGYVETVNGKVRVRSTVIWSADGRVTTDETQYESGPVATRRIVRDERGWVSSTDEGGDVQTFERSDSWACRSVKTITRDADGKLLDTSHTRCNADGLPERTDFQTEDGRIVNRIDYLFESGRLIEQLRRSEEASIGTQRIEYRRDERGALSELRFDRGADGTIDEVSTFDLSCWVVDDDAIHYRPK